MYVMVSYIQCNKTSEIRSTMRIRVHCPGQCTQLYSVSSANQTSTRIILEKR